MDQRDIKNEIIRIITEKIKCKNPYVEEVKSTADLRACSCQFGISSLQLVNLFIEIEDEFGVTSDKGWSSIEKIADAIISQEIRNEKFEL